jgi:hypothetical protein
MKFGLLKPVEDRFFRGLVAGVIAGILKDIPDILLVNLSHLKRQAFWDYVGEMIFNKIPRSFPEHFWAFGIEVTFSLGLGVIYSMIIIPVLPTRHYLIRGAVYGSACWFMLISTVKLFHITPLFTRDLFTPLTTLLFSSGYGIMLAFLDELLTPQKQASNS